MPVGAGLPTNVDTTYADSGTDASVQLHQQHHDTVHSYINNAPYFLTYDQTGVTNAGPALQTAIDNGFRHIVIPPGTFYANSAVFYDQQDGNATLRIFADGVVFNAGTGLPTAAEFEAQMTTQSRATGCKWFLFPSTLRAALSAGSVTCTGNDVPGTSTFPVSRNGISPHLIVEGGTFNASSITNYNAGFVFGNVGGATELRSVHMSSARVLLSWAGYVDANKIYNCGGWGATNMTAAHDAWLFYQFNNGDGVIIDGCKTDNFIGCASLFQCNGAHIRSTIGGGFRFDTCHAIVIHSNHTETAANISVVNRNIYYVKDSHITIDGSFDYLTESQATSGAVYLDDSNNEGTYSDISFRHWFARLWTTTSDPSPGWAIYVNKMNDRSVIRVRESFCSMSSQGAFATTSGQMGLLISGNATNEPTLAGAVSLGRDLIAGGDFDMMKASTSTVAAGQNSAMTITVTAAGPLGGIYVRRPHVQPTFFDGESYGTGTLANSTAYAYAAAVCNTLPDGTIEYGPVSTEWLQTSPASGGAQGFEMYMPSANSGATLVLWRKTGTGVLTAPDRYVPIPINITASRFLDTGANINRIPWITTSVPVPNTVASVSRTGNGLFVNGMAIGPNDVDPTTPAWFEDFLGGNFTTGQLGELGWQFNGGTAPAWKTAEAGHPGIVTVSSTATANIYASLYLGWGTTNRVLFNTDLWDVTFWVRPNQVDANTTMRVGVTANTGATGGDGAWFERLAADTNWFMTTQGASQTRTSWGSAPTVAWTKMRVRMIGTSVVGFTIGAATEQIVTTNMPTVPVMPFVNITSTTTVAKTIDVDACRIALTGLSR